MTPSRPEVELTPEQPPAVAEQVAAVVDAGPRAPDPWWQAGLEEQLEQ